MTQNETQNDPKRPKPNQNDLKRPKPSQDKTQNDPSQLKLT